MNSAKTAITRKKPSVPMRWLDKQGMLKGDKMLDYGCGKGFDADHYKMDKYDPYHCHENTNLRSTCVKHFYDVITCNYVLNTVDEDNTKRIITDILSLLKENGNAYITVRRDIKNEGYTSRGTLQRNVLLDSAISIRKTSTYEIYTIRGK